MGALDAAVAKMKILVTADTSQAKREVRELSGEEKKAAKERLDAIEKENLKLEGSIKTWTKFAAGIAGAVGAYKLMSAAATAAIEDAKKSGTAGEGAAKAWTDATAKWKGSVDQLMVGFGKLVIQLAPLVDAMADLVGLIAQGVELLNRPRQSSREFISTIGAFGQITGQLFSGQRSYSRQVLDMGARLSGPNALGLPDDFFSVDHMEKNRGLMDLYGAGILRVQDAWGDLAERLQPKKGGKGRDLSTLTKKGLDPLKAFPDLFGAGATALGDVQGAIGRTYQDARGFRPLSEATDDSSFQATMKAVREETAGLADEVERMVELKRQQGNTTLIEGIFGPLEQFNAYAAGFQLLQNAATAAFDAWITGQSSIGDAIKAAIATGLRAVAIEMGIQALKHTAYGFGALALGPIAGASASGHFAAAGLFTAGAAAAGLAAKQMYAAGWGGGGVPSTSGMGGGSSRGAGGFIGGSGQEQASGQVTIMLGSDFGMLTTLEQKTLLSSAIRLGLSRTRGTRRIRRGA